MASAYEMGNDGIEGVDAFAGLRGTPGFEA